MRVIRKALRTDIPSLCALENVCFSEPWSEKGFADFFENPCSCAYLCEEDGEAAGYIGMYLVLGEGEITDLAVFPAFRRRGIGEALLAALARTDGLERLLLDVRESNLPARRLYEKCGFTVDGVRKRFYSHPIENGVLMSRSVTKD